MSGRTSARALTVQQAEAIWAVLVEECGASSDHGFVHHQTHEYVVEWRFIGTLGFGGKFWRNNTRRPDGSWGEHWYVNYYPEHRTPGRDADVARANVRLWELCSSATSADES